MDLKESVEEYALQLTKCCELLTVLESKFDSLNKKIDMYDDIWDDVEEKVELYYVHFLSCDSESFLNRRDNGDLFVADKDDYPTVKTKFTEQEIKDIDKLYWNFAVPVEGY